MKLRFVILYILFSSITALAQEVQKISIKTTRSGWGNKHAEVEITKKGQDYVGGGGKVDEALIKNLMDVLVARAEPELNVENLGTNDPWIKRNEGTFLKDAKDSELRLLKEALNKPATIDLAVRSYYKSYWTDDYASTDVQVATAAGVFKISSKSQHAFMIPWVITSPKGVVTKTWNSGIGKSIAALLPDGTLNQDRMSGSKLASALKSSLKYSMRDVFEAAESEEVFKKQMDKLRKKYLVSQPSVAVMSGLGFDVDGLHVTLTGGDLVQGIQVDGHLVRKGQQLNGLDSFLAAVPKYGALVAKVPWLLTWLKAQPGAKVEINIVDGVSMTSKGIESLRDDLTSKRKDLMSEIGGMLSQSVLLTITEGDRQYSRWLVLPDRRMMLWHATGLPVVKWNASSLPKSWEEAGQDTYGVLVSPDGKMNTLN